MSSTRTEVGDLQGHVVALIQARAYFDGQLVVEYDGTQYDQIKAALLDPTKGVAVLVRPVTEETIIDEVPGVASVEAIIRVRFGINPVNNATGAGLTLEAGKTDIIKALRSFKPRGGESRYELLRDGKYTEEVGGAGQLAVEIAFTREAVRTTED